MGKRLSAGKSAGGKEITVSALQFMGVAQTEKMRFQDAIIAWRQVTLPSASGATPQYLVTDAEVPAGYKPYILSFYGKVDGATDWASTGSVVIQSNDGTVTFATLAVAALTGNSRLTMATANITLEDAIVEGTGGVTGGGVKVLSATNGTGSDLKLSVLILFLKSNDI